MQEREVNMNKAISIRKKIVACFAIGLIVYVLSPFNCYAIPNNGLNSDSTSTIFNSADQTQSSSDVNCNNHLFAYDYSCRFIQIVPVKKQSKFTADINDRFLFVQKTFSFEVFLKSAQSTIPHFYSFQYLIPSSLFDLKTSLLIYH